MDQIDVETHIPSPRVDWLRLTKAVSIPLGLMINESTNEGTQAIINRLYPELLGIPKESLYYTNQLALIVGDHKTWARILSTMFQHQVQESSVYEQYGWILPIGALFHLQLNMIDMLLNNHYGSTKVKDSARSNLRNHVEFWGQKKCRPKGWDFYATEELILQSHKARIVATLWNVVESDKSSLDLDELKSWISTAPLSKLLKKIDEVCSHLSTVLGATAQDDELRNHVFFCQQVKAYLLLKYAISSGDIGFLPHAIARAAVLFHDCRKFNYQTETLFIFWVTSTDASLDELKRAILANSLVNIQGKENKFIPLDLHLELHNGYMKKVMRDRQTSLIDIERLFEYSSRFASTVRDQLLWMERFYGVRVNIKHSLVSQEGDLIKLAYKLRSEMRLRVNRPVPTTDRAQDLYAVGSAALWDGTSKFNRKWDSVESALAEVEVEDPINCDLADLHADQDLDQWAQENELADLFSVVPDE